MPDIAMCSNNKCPSRFECYRFMAIPSDHRQAYMDFEYDEKTGHCDKILKLQIRRTQ